LKRAKQLRVKQTRAQYTCTKDRHGLSGGSNGSARPPSLHAGMELGRRPL
jgi:hypothetical protein